MSHTPGKKWRWVHAGSWWILVDVETDEGIVETQDHIDDDIRDLIASAPDMKARIEELEGAIKSVLRSRALSAHGYDELHARLADAINKAPNA